MLTSKDVAKLLDHSTLQPYLTEADIRRGCELALKYGTATVCAQPQDMEISATNYSITSTDFSSPPDSFLPSCKASKLSRQS